MSILLIVESPAKAKTITKYLGAGYTVRASMGHVRDLPKKELGVDVENGFEPQYQPIEGKDKVIGELRDAAQKHKLLVTLEDNALAGGFGSGVAEWLCDHGMSVPLLRLGVPDRFIEYGMISEQMAECGLDAQSVRQAILDRMTNL